MSTMFEIPSLSPELLEKYMAECLVENGLDPGLIGNKSRYAKPPTVDQESCYLACMDKKVGLLKDDGTYNEDIILSNAETPEMRSDFKKKFDDTMKMCQAEAGDNLCKLAACINRQPRNFYV